MDAVARHGPRRSSWPAVPAPGWPDRRVPQRAEAAADDRRHDDPRAQRARVRTRARHRRRLRPDGRGFRRPGPGHRRPGRVPARTPGAGRRPTPAAIRRALALDLVGDDFDVVLFHDAARPLVEAATIAACLSALEDAEAVSVAVELSDTVVVTDAGRITAIPARALLRRLQTPQGFRVPTIRRAHALAAADPDFRATDDCGVVLRYLPDVPIHIVDRFGAQPEGHPSGRPRHRRGALRGRPDARRVSVRRHEARAIGAVPWPTVPAKPGKPTPAERRAARRAAEVAAAAEAARRQRRERLTRVVAPIAVVLVVIVALVVVKARHRREQTQVRREERDRRGHGDPAGDPRPRGRAEHGRASVRSRPRPRRSPARR